MQNLMLFLNTLIFILLTCDAKAERKILSDTIFIDLAFEKPDFYVYHLIEDKVPKFYIDWQNIFSDKDKSKLILKHVDTKKPFTGVLIVQDNENSAKYTCPYLNGIPNGIWKKHTHDWYQECTAFSLLEYTIPIQMGFPHGEGKRWSYNNKCESRLIGIVNYDMGKPNGYYKKVNEDQIIEGNLLFEYPQKQKNTILKYDSPTHYGRTCVTSLDAENIFYIDYPKNLGVDEQILKCPYSYLKDSIAGPPSYKISIKDSLRILREEDDLLKDEEFIWKNGLLVKFNEYHNDDYLPKEENYLQRSIEYDYYCGYAIYKFKERITHSVYDYFFTVHSSTKTGLDGPVLPNWEIESFPFSSFSLDTTLYIDYKKIGTIYGEYKHGYYKNEWNPGTFKIGDFQIPYYLAEGEYYFGKKTGTWKYFVFIDHKKILIGSEDYKIVKTPDLEKFIIGKDFCGFCDYTFSNNLNDSRVDGNVQLYNLDGTVYLGYSYKNNQPVKLLVKPK